jgi:hypothetical protein
MSNKKFYFFQEKNILTNTLDNNINEIKKKIHTFLPNYDKTSKVDLIFNMFMNI